ncbi:TOBE domain-containing protein, partial [Litorivicinus sp.]|nr:TOBE domain-containing protein [Litorivicinus sp.]
RVSVMDSGKIVQAADPMELYRSPATHFVAGFIGNPPMNFLKAQPTQSNVWNVAGIEYQGPNTASGDLLCAIRPEDVTLSPTGLPAKILMIEPLGPHLLVTTSIADTAFRAILDLDSHVQVGDQIFLKPILERIRWFDPSSKLAVHA